MPKKIYLEEHYTVEEWHNNIKHIRNNEHKLKMLVIEKVLSNPSVSAKEVQVTFFISPRTMYNWINQYNEAGLDGLIAKSLNGRGSGKGNKKVDDKIYLSLKEAIVKEPSKKWTGKEKERYIKEKFDIEVSEQAIAYRMKKL